MNYHDVNLQFPKGAQWPTGVQSAPRLTFFIYLYPFLEQAAIYNEFVFNTSDSAVPWESKINNSTGTNPPNSAFVKTFICPSDSGLMTVGNGSSDGNGVAFKWITGNYCAVFPGTDCNDAYNATIATRTALGSNFGATISKITDGTSNTLLLAEYVRAMSATDDIRGAVWVDEAGCTEVYTKTPSGATGNYTPNTTAVDILYHCTTLPAQNRPCIQNETATVESAASRSMHTNGVNVLLCDGSVHFITNGISPTTWASAATIAGGEVPGSDW